MGHRRLLPARHHRRSHPLSIDTEPRIDVPCHDCGSRTNITVSWCRRQTAAGKPIRCEMCKRLSHATADEDALWFWLERYGEQRNGHTALEHVQIHGLPDGLSALIGMIGGTRTQDAA